jgi:hypothetical protein
LSVKIEFFFFFEKLELEKEKLEHHVKINMSLSRK